MFGNGFEEFMRWIAVVVGGFIAIVWVLRRAWVIVKALPRLVDALQATVASQEMLHERWERQDADDEDTTNRLQRLEERLDIILDEVTINGGSTLKDHVVLLEQRINEMCRCQEIQLQEMRQHYEEQPDP